MKSKDEFENIEIKLQIEDTNDETKRDIEFKNKSKTLTLSIDRVYNKKTDDKDDHLGDLNIINPMTEEQTNLKSKKKMKLNFSIEKNESLSSDSKSKINIKFGDVEYLFDLKENTQTVNYMYIATNLDKIKYDINTKEIFKNNEGLVLKIKLKNVEYIHDDVSVLLPTGLFI